MPTETCPIRVAPVPAHHPYVDAVLPPAADLHVVVPPAPEGTEPGTWLPHPYLKASTVRGLRRQVDVIHVHFGFEHRSPQQIRDFVEACREQDILLVVTVHDLENPHLEGPQQQDHHTRLATLIGAADAVLTLTASAAETITRTFGRRATVVPHPYVVEPTTAAALLRERPGETASRMIGLFLKDTRANTVRDLDFYLALRRTLGQGSLRIFAHRESRDRPLIKSLRDQMDDVLHLHERMDDADLFARIAGLDVVILPYARGTHSGWLEMCRDLGAAVVAPDCGHYQDQADRQDAVFTYRTGDGSDAASAALRALAVTAQDSPRGPVLAYRGDRRAQRRRVVCAHRELLRTLMADRRTVARP